MGAAHIVRSFDQELGALRDLLMEMASLAEHELESALKALETRDAVAAAAAAASDAAVNKQEHLIDNLAVSLIARRQPMANDLRTIVAGLRISTDLERIGDYAKSLANHSVTLAGIEPVGVEPAIVKLGAKVMGLLRASINAYVRADADEALAVRAGDVAIDQAYSEVFRTLLNLNTQDAARTSACVHLILVARALERIGDHATNIGEHVLFAITGGTPAENRPKADRTAFMTAETS